MFSFREKIEETCEEDNGNWQLKCIVISEYLATKN